MLGALSSSWPWNPGKRSKRAACRPAPEYGLPRLAPFGNFRTLDGFIALCAPMQEFSAGLFRAMGQPELVGGSAVRHPRRPGQELGHPRRAHPRVDRCADQPPGARCAERQRNSGRQNPQPLGGTAGTRSCTPGAKSCRPVIPNTPAPNCQRRESQSCSPTPPPSSTGAPSLGEDTTRVLRDSWVTPRVRSRTCRAVRSSDPGVAAASGTTMRAVRCTSLGDEPPSPLDIADIPVPAPGPGQVLIRVQACRAQRRRRTDAPRQVPAQALAPFHSRPGGRRDHRVRRGRRCRILSAEILSWPSSMAAAWRSTHSATRPQSCGGRQAWTPFRLPRSPLLTEPPISTRTARAP